jgi:hypothetical protein
MTTKRAIKARCHDCLAGGGVCTFTDSTLKGLAREKGKVKTRVIKAYYRWCLNGHQLSVCSSPDCAIFQFRKERERPRTIPRICSQTGGTEGGKASPEPKAIETYGKGCEALPNAI